MRDVFDNHEVHVESIQTAHHLVSDGRLIDPFVVKLKMTREIKYASIVAD
jgi:hypothetical protein